MKALTTCVSLLLLSSCVLSDEELPTVRVRSTPEPCWMPVPPPTPVVTVGADPSECLPAPVRERGLDVLVHVSPDGHATGVEDLLTLCLEVGPDGEVIPQHRLSPSESQCILRSLRDWRFAGATTCWPAYAHVAIGPSCSQPGPGGE